MYLIIKFREPSKHSQSEWLYVCPYFQDTLGPKIADYSDMAPVTTPVELSGKNEWGIYGVGGNFYEWTIGISNSFEKHGVLRGASWRDGMEKGLRCEALSKFADIFDGNPGFRVVLLK